MKYFIIAIVILLVVGFFSMTDVPMNPYVTTIQEIT
jgi:hypothetical protein